MLAWIKPKLLNLGKKNAISQSRHAIITTSISKETSHLTTHTLKEFKKKEAQKQLLLLRSTYITSATWQEHPMSKLSQQSELIKCSSRGESFCSRWRDIWIAVERSMIVWDDYRVGQRTAGRCRGLSTKWRWLGWMTQQISLSVVSHHGESYEDTGSCGALLVYVNVPVSVRN